MTDDPKALAERLRTLHQYLTDGIPRPLEDDERNSPLEAAARLAEVERERDEARDCWYAWREQAKAWEQRWGVEHEALEAAERALAAARATLDQDPEAIATLRAHVKGAK